MTTKPTRVAAVARPAEATVGRGASRIAVAVVNFNTREHLDACLASVAAERAVEVVVVDNASTDGSAELVRSRYPNVTLVANRSNPGYGAGANRAMRACRSPYVLLLNSDTRVRAGALRTLAGCLELHPAAGLVGPRLVGVDGTIQASCFPFPTPLQTFLQMTFVGPLIGRVPGVGRLYRPACSPATGERVPWLLGAALAVRREAFDAVGGFDERFLMYSEEVDLCYRLAQAGWEVRFTPLAEVVHAGGASTGQDRVAMEVERYAATRRFYRKHYSRAARRMLVALTTYRMLHNLARDRGRIAVARRGHERDALAERISVWRRVLAAAWET